MDSNEILDEIPTEILLVRLKFLKNSPLLTWKSSKNYKMIFWNGYFKKALQEKIEIIKQFVCLLRELKPRKDASDL